MASLFITDFDRFWAKYPRKEKKKDAQKAWSKIQAADVELIFSTIDTHIRYWRRRKREFIPLAGTWLRGEQWTDEIEERTELLEDDRSPAKYGVSQDELDGLRELAHERMFKEK